MNAIRHLILVCLGLLTFAPNVSAVVKDAAQLQGNLLEDGTANLNSSTPKSILWNLASSIDPTAFEHSFETGHQLKVLKDGDYLVLATVPYATLPNAADNRPVQKIEVYVNGDRVPGTIGQSSYIRNQPRNANIQNESSDHSYSLIPDLKAGDVIEVKVNKHGSVANISQISAAATLYAELVDDSRSVFAGLTSGPADGDTSLLRDVENGEDPAPIAWDSIRKDSGYTHSDGGESISLSSGNYLVFVNLPLNGPRQRASVAGRVLIDGEPIELGAFQQGYIRDANGHVNSSIHYAGVLELSGNSRLSIETEQRAVVPNDRGPIIIADGTQGSIYIERLGSDGVFRSTAAEVDADVIDNFNPPQKAAMLWDSANISDTGTYNHSSGDSEVTVRSAGSYLLVYHDNMQSSVNRPNPKITVEVNGVEVRGAETKTHYIRNANGHNHSSAALAIVLEDLSANDRITVSTVAEGQQGNVVVDDFELAVASVALIKKEDADFGDAAIAPRFVGYGGDENGWFLNFQEFSAPIDIGTITAMENGEPVAVQANRSGSIVTVSRPYPAITDINYPAQGEALMVEVKFGDHSATASINVPQTFVSLRPELIASADVDSSSSGFTGEISQINVRQIGNNNHWFHNNQEGLAELQHAGLATDLSGQPYRNQIDVDWENADGWVRQDPFETDLVNYDQATDEGPGGDNFDDATGHPNTRFPGIGPDNDPDYEADDPDTDGLVGVWTTWIELPKGITTMGVNSDDRFKVTSGFSPEDQQVLVGLQNGGGGATNFTFDVVTYEAGTYPFRLLWWEGRAGASVEWFTEKDGERHLINDRADPNALKAYSKGKGRPAVVDASPTGNHFAEQIAIQIETGIGLSNLKLSVDGTAVNATVVEGSGRTSVSYSPDGGFAEGPHSYTVSFEDSAGSHQRTFSFEQPGGVEAVLRANPFAYWRLGDCEGDSAIASIGQNLDARYVNGVELGAERLVPADPGTSIRLDGSKEQWVSIPNHWRINDVGSGGPPRRNTTWHEKSVELWFNADRLPRADGSLDGSADPNRMATLYEQGGGDRALAVYLYGTEDSDDPNEAELGFFAFNRMTDNNIGSAWGAPENEPNTPLAYISTPITKGETYHVVASFDGDFTPNDQGLSGVMRLFVNGKQVGEVEGVGVLYNHTGDVRLGWADIRRHDNFNGASGYYSGRIDGVALYGRALSVAEAKAHYTAGLVEVPAIDCGSEPPPVVIEPEPTPEPPVVLPPIVLPPIPGQPAGPASVEIIRAADGTLSIAFSGSLSAGPTVDGPFLPIPGATSPFVVNPEAASQFFIAR